MSVIVEVISWSISMYLLVNLTEQPDTGWWPNPLSISLSISSVNNHIYNNMTNKTCKCKAFSFLLISLALI